MNARRDENNRERYERIIDRYLRECFRKQVPVRASQLSAKLHANRSYISDLVKRLFGKTLKSILCEKQVAFAATLLEHTYFGLNEICAMSGFGHRTTFFRLFERHLGVTPQAYRKQTRGL